MQDKNTELTSQVPIKQTPTSEAQNTEVRYTAQSVVWQSHIALPFLITSVPFFIIALVSGKIIIILLPLSLFLFALLLLKVDDNKAYLLLSPRGLEYHSPSLIIKTEWGNVKSITRGFSGYQLILYKPAATYVDLGITRPSLSMKEGKLAITGEPSGIMDRCIHLDAFGYTPTSALALDILKYAPHLRFRT